MGLSALRPFIERAAAASSRKATDKTDALSIWIAEHVPDIAEAANTALVGQLAALPELGLFDNTLQLLGNAGPHVSFQELATWLVRRTLKVGSERALADLERYIEEPDFPYLAVTALVGVSTDVPIELVNNITIRPPWELAWSFAFAVIQSPTWTGLSYPEVPSAVIVQKCQASKRHVRDSDRREFAESVLPRLEDPWMTWLELSESIELALALVGPCTPMVVSRWLIGDESVPSPTIFGDVRVTNSEQPRGHLFLQLAAVEARSVVGQYMAMSPAVRKELAIPLERLRNAMLEKRDVDAAIDLGIAMESTFLHGQEGAELTFKLALTAARYLEADPDRRIAIFKRFKDLYELRSKAIHEGRLPPTKAPGARALMDEGCRDMATALQKIIHAGEWPDWRAVALS